MKACRIVSGRMEDRLWWAHEGHMMEDAGCGDRAEDREAGMLLLVD